MQPTRIKFIDLPHGARFRYVDKKTGNAGEDIWIKLGNDSGGPSLLGLVAAYDPRNIRCSWPGQFLGTFADTEQEMRDAYVEVAEPVVTA